MPSTISELNTPATDGTPLSELPRGLLPYPKHIVDHLTGEQARLGLTFADDKSKQSLDYMTLVWYFQGQEVAYRSTPEGLEICAVGVEEVAQFLSRTPLEQRRDVHVMEP